MNASIGFDTVREVDVSFLSPKKKEDSLSGTKKEDNDDEDKPKIYVRRNGIRYITAADLLRSEKVRKLLKEWKSLVPDKQSS